LGVCSELVVFEEGTNLKIIKLGKGEEN